MTRGSRGCDVFEEGYVLMEGVIVVVLVFEVDEDVGLRDEEEEGGGLGYDEFGDGGVGSEDCLFCWKVGCWGR